MNNLPVSHIVVGLVVAIVANIDHIIVFALRFFDADTIKSELDRLEVIAKHEVDKEAALKAQATAAAQQPKA